MINHIIFRIFQEYLNLLTQSATGYKNPQNMLIIDMHIVPGDLIEPIISNSENILPLVRFFVNRISIPLPTSQRAMHILSESPYCC